MTLSTIEAVMSNLSDISNAGERQSKRVKDILKLMVISVHEHDAMMAVPEYVANYVAFLGEDGLATAQATRDNFATGLQMFVDSGIITQDELHALVEK